MQRTSCSISCTAWELPDRKINHPARKLNFTKIFTKKFTFDRMKYSLYTTWKERSNLNTKRLNPFKLKVVIKNRNWLLLSPYVVLLYTVESSTPQQIKIFFKSNKMSFFIKKWYIQESQKVLKFRNKILDFRGRFFLYWLKNYLYIERGGEGPVG